MSGVKEVKAKETIKQGSQVGAIVSQPIALSKSSIKARKIVNDLVDALQFCSGSDDFSIEGKARKGWEKLCMPALNKACKWLNIG